jgi:mannose-6-phosphate isomerase-like protein (cupin superfamily)
MDAANGFVVAWGEGREGVAQSGPYQEIASLDETGDYRLLYNAFGPDKWAHEPHSHSDSEAFYVLEGDYEMHIGDEVFTVEKGGFVFIRPGVTHTFRSGANGASKLTILGHPT